MEAPTVGERAICSQCGKEIVFVGPYWDHLGEIKPRHPAIPLGPEPLQPGMSEQLTRSQVAEIVREEARAIAEQAIAERTIPDFPAYFMGNDWLITYEWLAFERNSLMQHIYRLDQRIAQLERPWWRRWLHR